jgi:hypothetical protein
MIRSIEPATGHRSSQAIVWRGVSLGTFRVPIHHGRETGDQTVQPPALGVTLGDRWKTMQASVP